jgi:hypothetical protein
MNLFIFFFFLFGDGVSPEKKKKTDNCIFARSAWCI